MRWSLIFAFIGVVLWNQPGISAKIVHFTDKEGTVHISNESQAEPEKPSGVQAPAPMGPTPPHMLPPATSPAPGPLPGLPPPVEPQETSDNEAKPPAPETGGEAQPAPAVPPTQVTPGQED